jgi:hypothetical protein
MTNHTDPQGSILFLENRYGFPQPNSLARKPTYFSFLVLVELPMLASVACLTTNTKCLFCLVTGVLTFFWIDLLKNC